MGLEFTPVFLLLIVAIGNRGEHDRCAARCSRRRSSRASSKCRTNRGWTRRVTPGSGLTFASTWSRSCFCCSMSSCFFSIPGPWPSGARGSSAPRASASAGIPAEFRGLVFWEIMVFIVILAAAFAYAWRKGVFEWR